MKFLNEEKGASLNPSAELLMNMPDYQTHKTNHPTKTSCEFCNMPMQHNLLSSHEESCPALSLHRCYVCDKVFRKKHFLIKHMHEQNHFILPNLENQQSGKDSLSSYQTDTQSL